MITTLIYTLALIVKLSLISGSVQSAGFDDLHQTSDVYSPDDKIHAQGESQLSPLEDYAFYTISYPGASSTTLRDINNAGEIVGTYRHPDFSGTRSFLYSEGSFVQIHVPGSDDTDAYGINDAGEIVGTYNHPNFSGTRGFLYSEGSFITIHYPNAAWTLARGINNDGQIVGWFWEGGTYHGYYSFIVSDGVLQKIGNPGDCNLFAWDINDAGEITGDYYNWDQNRYYGFVLKDGALNLFLIPGSTHTEARGINNDGQIVGAWPAYLYSDGEFGIWSLGDVFYGINDAGVLVGRGGGYSWVATPAINLGQVTLAYGDVSISGNPVNAGTSVRNGDSLSVGEDGFLVFTLSAESGERAIWVDANSELSVAGESTSSESTIEFRKGRIRAIIRDLPEGYSLEMRMEGTALAVRGTEFLIEGDDTSYVATVLEGLVEVSTTDGAQSVFVKEDHEIEVTPEGLGVPYPIDPNEVLDWWNFREVTFNIDMTNAVGFDPNQHYVCLTGDFTNWAEPGTEDCLEMSQINPDKPDALIYTCTTEILPREYDYKYFSDAFGQGWDGAEWEGDSMRTLTVNDHMVVNDTWGKYYYTLTLLAEPPTGGTVEGGGSYQNGTLVDLAAFPSKGYEFINWTDDQDTEVSDQASFAYTMPADNITLIAYFVEEDDEDPEQNIITFNVKDQDNQPVSDAKITITPGGPKTITGLNNIKNNQGNSQVANISPQINKEAYIEIAEFDYARKNQSHNAPESDNTEVILPGNWAQANAVGTYFWGGGDDPLGWVFGNNTYGDTGVGMHFNVQETHTIAGAYFWISNAASGSGDVHFHIHEFNGEPGDALASASVALNDLEPFPTGEGVSPDDYLEAFYVEFDNPVEVTGHVFVSVIFGDLDWNEHGDGMASTVIGQGGGGLDWAWINGSDGVWVKATAYNELLDLDIGVFTVIQNIILYTNTGGQASFQAADGDYLYTVEKSGYNSYSGDFTVSGNDVNIDITLAGSDEVPENRPISDKTIADGDTDCFDATQTITVSDFTVEAGGSATLIAGQSITLLPGSIVQAGGYLHAYITTEGIFCGDLEKHFLEPAELPELIADTPKDDKSDTEQTSELPQEATFRVYPNPTPGVFTLELTGYDQEATIVVDVFGLRGETILRKEIPGSQQLHTFSLEGQQPGIYFIRVMDGKQAGVQRIVKQ